MTEDVVAWWPIHHNLRGALTPYEHEISWITDVELIRLKTHESGGGINRQPISGRYLVIRGDSQSVRGEPGTFQHVW